MINTNARSLAGVLEMTKIALHTLSIALVPRYEVRPCMLALYFLGETSKVFRLVKTSKVFAGKHRRCFR